MRSRRGLGAEWTASWRGLNRLCWAGLLSMALNLPTARAADQADWWVYVNNDASESVQALLNNGADPNAPADNGQPALMRAVVEGAWHVFDVLAADPRTNVNATNPANETPLMYLAITGQTERARRLIARGAAVNRPGWTPLHYAASKAQMEVARLLLDKHAQVNASGPKGETPLMMAALSGRSEIVQLLLQAGADRSQRDQDGKTAADWAERGQSSGLAENLRTGNL